MAAQHLEKLEELQALMAQLITSSETVEFSPPPSIASWIDVSMPPLPSLPALPPTCLVYIKEPVTVGTDVCLFHFPPDPISEIALLPPQMINPRLFTPCPMSADL